MPFIVYFFLSLLVIYIPLPTFFLLVNRLAEQHDAITALTNETLFTSICLSRLLYELILAKTDKSKKEILFLPCLFQSL